MKNLKLHLLYAFVLGLGMLRIQAQQLPLAPIHIFQPELLNPAMGGAEKLHRLNLIHSQQGLLLDGWSATNQFLSYASRPLGGQKRFGWGINLSNSQEHSERRLEFSPSVAVRFIETEELRASAGLSLGVIQWASNYSAISVADPGDELIASPFSFLELNAGLGGEFRYETKFIHAEGGVMTTQLPRNFLNNQQNGMNLAPHLLANAMVLGRPVYNIKVGPKIMYKNIFNNRDSTLQAATLDAGIQVEFDRQDMWFAGTYRIDRSALSLGLGFRIVETDTFHNPSKFATFVDFNLACTYPIRESSVFGPEVNLGLNILFGKRKLESSIDTTTLARTFWKNDGYLNSHKVMYLDPTSPDGLKAHVEKSGRKVSVFYEFPDNSYLYTGYDQLNFDTLVGELGFEWQGVDGLMENIAHEVIREGLTPRTEGIEDPENLEPLKTVTSIELSAFLRVNSIGADIGAEGTIYEGELGTNNATDDTLFIKIVFDDIDTTIAIRKFHYLSNLELACLKLYSMRSKLTHEMNLAYGDDKYVIWEGEGYDPEEMDGRQPVWVKKLRIVTDFPNQQSFQINQIKIRFLRFKKYVTEDENDGWIPNRQYIRKGGESKKNKKKLKKEKKQEEKKRKIEEKESKKRAEEEELEVTE